MKKVVSFSSSMYLEMKGLVMKVEKCMQAATDL
jgi:hypothetical protein